MTKDEQVVDTAALDHMAIDGITNDTARLTRRLAWLTTAVLCTVQFVDVLATTIVIVALPTIQRHLSLSDANRELVVSVYAVTFGSLLLLAGRLADVFGARRLFLAGLGVFAAASLLGGTATGPFALLTGRAGQGIGAALAVPAAMAMLTSLFPAGPDRNRALGVWTAMGAAGGAAGFAVGGIITDGLGWRWTLLINVPIIAAAAVAILVVRADPMSVQSGRVPVLNGMLLTAGLLALIYGLGNGQADGLRPLTVLGPIATGLVLLIGFVRVERRSADPLMPVTLLRSPALIGASVVSACLTFTTSAAAVLLTVYLQDTEGMSAVATGWLFAPFSVAVIVGSFAGSQLTSAGRVRATIMVGLSLVGLSLALWGVAVEVRSVGGVTAGLVVSGVGLGMASVAATSVGLAHIAPERQGVASGVLNAAARVGTAIGIAVFGVAAAIGTQLLPRQDGEPALVAGAPWALSMGIVVTIGTLLLAWRTMARIPQLMPEGRHAAGDHRQG